MSKTARISALELRRDAIVAELSALDDTVIERGTDLDGDEKTNYVAREAELAEVTDTLKGLIERQAQVDASVTLGSTLAVTPAGGAVVRTADPTAPEAEGPVYRADSEHGLAMDLFRSRHRGDTEAAARIGQHIERAASTSAQLAGLVVPQYVTSDLVGLAREGRPFLNVLNSRPVLGSTVILPRVTTGLTTGAQATENTAFASTALVTEEVTISTKTVGGYTDLSVQAVEWGPLDESWLFSELLSDLYTRMDYLALHGSGGTGEPEGLFESDGTNVVDADTASAFAEYYAVVTEAASLIRKNDKRMATHVLMSSARWYALMSAMDADGRPLMGFQGSSPTNVGGDATGPTFAGLKVVIDDNVVKTGEDDTFMAVIAAPSLYLAESSPKQLVCDCVVAHTGSVRYVLRSFMAFSAEIRPKSVTIIQDLTPPEFPSLAIS